MLLQQNMDSYNSYRPILVGLNLTLVFSFFMKQMFNVFASLKKTKKIPLDKWSQMEIFSACLALGIQYLLEITSIENLMEVDYKDYLDYAVCALSLI